MLKGSEVAVETWDLPMGHLPNFTALELPKGPRSAAVAKSAKSEAGGEEEAGKLDMVSQHAQLRKYAE